MAVVSAVVFYGQQNLDRFTMMADYWRHAMKPEERNKLYILSATDAHARFSDKTAKDLFCAQCRRLKHGDAVSSTLLHEMRKGIDTVAGIQLHIVCGGEQQDPQMPLKFAANFRAKVKPINVNVFYYLMAEESPDELSSQRAFARALDQSGQPYTLYLLSAMDIVGGETHAFFRNRALACEILMQMRGQRNKINKINTLGYVSLHAFDEELSMLRRMALRDAALAQHDDTPIDSRNAWSILFPEGEKWQTFFACSKAWQDILPRAAGKKSGGKNAVWMEQLPECNKWETFERNYPSLDNNNSIRDAIQVYLEKMVTPLIRSFTDDQLENARVLSGIKGRDGIGRVLQTVADLCRANMSERQIREKVDLYSKIMARQACERLCGMFNAATFPEESVLTNVVDILHRMGQSAPAQPTLPEAPLSFVQKVMPGMANWQEYYKKQFNRAAKSARDYYLQLGVQYLARALGDAFDQEVKYFIRSLQAGDFFNRAAKAIIPRDISETELKDKYPPYCQDVDGAMNRRSDKSEWPYGEIDGSDATGYAAIYSYPLIRELMMLVKKEEDGQEENRGEQERLLELSERHTTQYLVTTINKENRRLQTEQSPEYRTTFIRALLTMKQTESAMDDFLKTYLGDSKKMLFMVHAQNLTMTNRTYFVDSGLESNEWVKKNKDKVMLVGNDNVECIDLYPVAEPLAELLKMNDNTLFGAQEDEDDAGDVIAADRDAGWDDDDDDDEGWVDSNDADAAKDALTTSKNQGNQDDVPKAVPCQPVTSKRNGKNYMVYWPVNYQRKSDFAKIVVQPSNKSFTTTNASQEDVTQYLVRGKNIVEVYYDSKLYAKGEVVAKLEQITYRITMKEKGACLQVNLPSDSRFVLREEGRNGHMVYPIRINESGVYEPLQLSSKAYLAEIGYNPTAGTGFEFVKK